MSCTAESAMRSASWSEKVRLAGKLQQTQNVNPQRGHEMPVPRGHINDDAPRRHRTAQQRSDPCEQQSEHAAHQVNSMSAGQQINERTARRGRQIEAVRSQLTPCRPLPKKKSQPEYRSYGKPGHPHLVTSDDSWIRE